MTTSTATLSSWLLDQIAADEAVALAATAGPWATWVSRKTCVESMAGEPTVLVQMAPCGTDDDAAHIAHHDPARVLATCAAHRRIVERAQRAAEAFDQSFNPTTSGVAMTMDLVLADLAAIYADRPGFREEWGV